MGGNKRSVDGTILVPTQTTAQNTDSGDNELAGTSNSNPRTPSRIDMNNELLRANPFLIPNVLARLCANSSPHALFKYRLVSHVWNEFVLHQINENHERFLRLVKVVDPNYRYPSWRPTSNNPRYGPTGWQLLLPGVVNVKEMISTLTDGKLKESPLTRIYLNSSVSPFDLNTFLQLNGHNIQRLHYDGDSLSDLRQILQACAKNLRSLSLWRSWKEIEGDNKGLLEIDCDLKFRRLQSLAIVSGELNTRMQGISNVQNNICNPSKAFLTQLFQTAPNLTSLSARFYDSSILESGLSFNKLTTLCVKFRIRNDQLRALCHVGLKLKKLRLQGLLIAFHDPEWRKVLLHFIRTQASTLEYFAVTMCTVYFLGQSEHNTPHEQWSSMTGFPRMPLLHTFVWNECPGQIPREEFSYLFPKLRNLEIVKCRFFQVAGPPQANITEYAEYPLQIPISSNPAIFVRNVRGIKPTMEFAQIFPSVTELHIENEIPVGLPMYCPKLKHLYYKESCYEESETRVSTYIRKISAFLVGISSEESEWIEEQRQRPGLYFPDLTELPRSHPSIFNLNELETFEFGFKSYEFESPLDSPGAIC